MKKLLDLSDECVKSLSKRAIDENTDFKNLAQDILERESKSNGFEKTKKRGQKNKKTANRNVKSKDRTPIGYKVFGLGEVVDFGTLNYL